MIKRVLLCVVLLSFAVSLAVAGPVVDSVACMPQFTASGSPVRVVVKLAPDSEAVSGITANGVPLSASADGVCWEGELIAEPHLGAHNVDLEVTTSAGGSHLLSGAASYQTLQVVGANTSSLVRGAARQTPSLFLFKIWGKAKPFNEEVFFVNDGWSYGTKVICPGHDIADGDFVCVEGTVETTDMLPGILNCSRYSILRPVERAAPKVTDVDVGKNLQTAVKITLPKRISTGRLPLTLTSSDPSRVVISNSFLATGGRTAVVYVTSGDSTVYVQGLSDSGSVDVTVTAPGHPPCQFKVNLYPSGFAFQTASINTSSVSPSSTFKVASARLNPTTGEVLDYQLLGPGGLGTSVYVTSSSEAVGKVTGGPIVFNSPMHGISREGTFWPVSAGSTTLSLVTPSGFATPSSSQSLPVSVVTPTLEPYSSPSNIGKDLQVAGMLYTSHDTRMSGGVTISIASPDIATVSADPELEGSGTATIRRASDPFYYYIQGRSLGTTTYTISAPGFDSVTDTVTVVPSGFLCTSTGFTTSVWEPDYNLSIRPAALNPGGIPITPFQRLRGGMHDVIIDTHLSDPSVGTISGSPLVFKPGDASCGLVFHPLIGGTTQIKFDTPPGFTTPDRGQSVTATVKAVPPKLQIERVGDGSVGKDLQDVCRVNMPPLPAPIDITCTVANPSVAVVSTDPNVPGAAAAVAHLTEPNSVASFWIQGLSQGETQISVSAPGCLSGSASVKVTPSGFTVDPNSLNTTLLSAPSKVKIMSCQLHPTTRYPGVSQPLRPGLDPVRIPLTSSAPSVGVMQEDPFTYPSAVTAAEVQFLPRSAGNTIITIGTPEGFSEPIAKHVVSVWVAGIYITTEAAAVGKDLQVAKSFGLTGPLVQLTDVLLEVADPEIAIVSLDPNQQGAGSVIAQMVGVTTQKYYVQGLKIGSTKLRISAPGYGSRETTITVGPSAFVLSSLDLNDGYPRPLDHYRPSTLSTYHGPEASVIVRAVLLNPQTFTTIGLPGTLRGGLTLEIPVVSSNPSVVALATDSATFVGGTDKTSFTIIPLSAGETTVSIRQPAGFCTPSLLNSVGFIVKP